MEIMEVPDILISKDGQLHSLREQKVWKGGVGHSFAVGSGIVKDGNLYVLNAPLPPLTGTLQTFSPNVNELVGQEAMLTDERDSRVYRCIKMADGRWWLGENLRARFGTFVEGQPTEIYGLLYDWESARDYVPRGWSLPSNAEWTALENSLGGKNIAGGKMKSTTGWDDYNGISGNGTNESSWDGLPGGSYYIVSGYDYKNKHCWWWSSEEYNYWGLDYNRALLNGPLSYNNKNRLSVRLILNG